MRLCVGAGGIISIWRGEISELEAVGSFFLDSDLVKILRNCCD